MLKRSGRLREIDGRTAEERNNRVTDRAGGEGRERAKLPYLIFVNICKELKCKDKRQDTLKKKNMTFKFM